MSKIDKIPTKVLLIIVFVLLTGIVFLAKAKHTPDTVQAWWDETWTYRQAIDIGWTGSNLTDFQVSFDIGTSALINAGKMQIDCDDIRITDQHGNLIPFWIEENNPGCNSPNGNTKIWVKAPTIPQGSATIYIYYGNSTASNIENGNNVFEFFDDFNAGSFDITKWTITGAPTVSGGVVSILGGQSITGKTSFGLSYVLRTRSSLASPSGSGNYCSIIFQATPGGSYIDSNNSYAGQYRTNTYNGTNYQGTNVSDISGYHVFEIQKISSSLSIFRKDNTDLASHTNYINTTSGPISFSANGTQWVYADWAIIHKYASSTPSSTPQSEEVTPGPIAYWKFDEGVGATAYDSAGNNHGTITSATWATEDQCISGKCLKFDGDNHRINFGNTTSLNTIGTQNFTISGWFKLNSHKNYNNIFSNKLLTDNSKGITLYTNSAGTLGAKLGNDSTNTTSTTTVNTNQWYFLTYIRNGNHQYLYLDGNLQDDDSTSTIYDISNSTNTYISDNSYELDGFIDEVKIYPYARTANQIKADYASGLAGMGGNSSVNIGGDSTGKSLSDGLVGYWTMDEGVGTSIVDKSGNGNTGTFGTGDSAPGWSTGKYGVGLSFNGASSYLSAGYNINPSSITISAWINRVTESSGRTIVSKGYQTSTGEVYWLYLTSTSKLVLYIGDGTNMAGVTTDDSISADTWHHVVATANNGTINLYIDGVLSKTGTVNVTSINTARTSWTTQIGMYWNAPGGNWYFEGLIDEVRIYNRALSASEVQTLYNWAPGPYLYLPFDDGSGTSINDKSGNNYSGTWHGSGNYWSSGKYGKAGYFDGSNNYVDFASLPKPASLPITIMFWAKPTTSTPVGIFDSAHNLQDVLRNYNTGSVEWWSSDPYVTLDLTANQWVHLSFSFSYSDGNQFIEWYKNGIKQTTASSPDDGTWAWNDFRLGNINGGTAGWYSGLLDEFKIYNYARTPKQILEDMNARSGASKSTIPIAHWSFDEGYGTSANDKVGGNTATFGTGSSAPSWTNNGKVGKALSFDGNDYIEATDNPKLRFNNQDFTISSWIKAPSDLLGIHRGIYSKGWYWDGEFAWYVHTDRKLRLIRVDQVNFGGNTIVADDNWHHVIAMRKGDDLIFYVDGKLDATSSSFFEGINLNTDKNVKIGYRGDSSRYFLGLIDEVKIYNYALSQDEITQDYNQGKSMVMGQSSSNTGSTASPGSASQEYCIPGSTDPCSPPIAEWNFEENVGTTAYDTSGNGNHANFGAGSSAPSWSMGHNNTGAGLNFDGNDDYVNAGTSLNIIGTKSISAWVKVSDTDNSNHRIFSKRESLGGAASTGYELVINPATCLVTFLHTGVSPTVTTTATGCNNNWKHITAVYTGTQGEIYIDGKYANAATFAVATTCPNPALVGTCGSEYNDGASGCDFEGLIDQVRIYNYARTPAQIAWDYNRGKPIAHYKLDEISGTTAHDSSGNNLHGTLGTGNSAPTWVSGKLNNAASFDGNDYINTTTATTLNIASASKSFSISLWTKTTGSSEYYLFDNYDGSPSVDISLRLDNGRVETLIMDGTNNNGTPQYGSGFNDGIWHHLLLSWDGAGKEIVYVDGKQIGSKTSPSVTGPLESGSAFRIGTRPYAGSSYLSGLIDDVQIYNYALTGDQIKTLYNNGAVSFN